jgi:hypothetical protein
MSRKDLLSGCGPALDLRQALYRACRDYRGGINAVALTMGIESDALAKALSPSDSRPIRAEWIEEIVTITKDQRLLAALVRPAGAVAFVPVPVKATADALKALSEMLKSESDFVGSLHKGAADAVWKPSEVVDLELHANVLIAQILSIVEGARQEQEGASHG